MADLHRQGGQRTDASGWKHQLLASNERINQRTLTDAGITEKANGQFLPSAARVGIDSSQRGVQVRNAIWEMNQKKGPNRVRVPRVKAGDAGGWQE
jgi:hypothetical protein